MSQSAASTEIPFIRCGDRQLLSRMQIERHPYIADFVERFPQCFEQHGWADYLLFWPEGDSPHPIKVK